MTFILKLLDKISSNNIKPDIQESSILDAAISRNQTTHITQKEISRLEKKATGLIVWAEELCNTIDTATEIEYFDAAYNNLIITLDELQELRKHNFVRKLIPDDRINKIYGSVSSAKELFEKRIIPSVPQKYTSKRMIISGLHMYFIDIARDIIESQKISMIPLMREYRLSKTNLDDIIEELRIAGIIDRDNQIVMSSEEFEKFIDIYEPRIFMCNNIIFDKDIFMCVGEILFEDGIEKTYDSLHADEIVDYLNIMEKLNVIKYNSSKNNYDVLIDKESFLKICECIPSSFSSIKFNNNDITYENVDYDSLSGLEFEKYCAYLLSQNGFSDITITPPSGDHGTDLLAQKEDIAYAIQCKCYSSNIGNAAIQQAHTGKILYHKDIAVVMTNRYFTQQAKDEAAQLGVKLWDRDKLIEFIAKVNK